MLDSWIAGWSRAEAYAKVKAVLAKHPDVAAVIGANDELAAGAQQALQESDPQRRVLISGQDADLSALINIVRDRQAMTVYKPLRSLARRAAEAAIALGSRRQLGTVTKMNNGYADIPAIVLEPILVDESNLFSTVVADGFQSSASIQAKVTKDEWESFQRRRKSH